mmetsp:Transcript_36082/g.102149  ORF Transcript_36082/g.102149 Transcript_36082/m.102149 type:complete len:261 (+) Transcript_36082:587-1369(+)
MSCCKPAELCVCGVEAVLRKADALDGKELLQLLHLLGMKQRHDGSPHQVGLQGRILQGVQGCTAGAPFPAEPGHHTLKELVGHCHTSGGQHSRKNAASEGGCRLGRPPWDAAAGQGEHHRSRLQQPVAAQIDPAKHQQPGHLEEEVNRQAILVDQQVAFLGKLRCHGFGASPANGKPLRQVHLEGPVRVLLQQGVARLRCYRRGAAVLSLLICAAAVEVWHMVHIRPNLLPRRILFSPGPHGGPGALRCWRCLGLGAGRP